MTDLVVRMQNKIRNAGVIDEPVVREVQLTSRGPSTVAFNPALVGKIGKNAER